MMPPSSGVTAALAAVPARGDEADVVSAEARCDEERRCLFSVTLRHADEGWKHYADQWEVRGPDGEVLGTRVLRHPHVDEQPFTRTLSDVRVPDGVSAVQVRARDSEHGWGGRAVEVEIPP